MEEVDRSVETPASERQLEAAVAYALQAAGFSKKLRGRRVTTSESDEDCDSMAKAIVEQLKRSNFRFYLGPPSKDGSAIAAKIPRRN